MPPASRSVPRERARAIGDGADRVAHVLEHALPELHEALGRRRHAHLAADAQEQRLAELLFEQQNLAADGRLRHVQLPAARGERAGFGDRLQDFELAQIHRLRASGRASASVFQPSSQVGCAERRAPVRRRSSEVVDAGNVSNRSKSRSASCRALVNSRPLSPWRTRSARHAP